MRAKDLMVGDWAYIYHPTRERTPVKVDGVWIETIERIDNGLTREDSPMFRIVEPIPLTPEILLKNGFENDFYEDVSVADYHSIREEGYSLKGRVEGWDDFLITFCNGSVNVVTDFHGEYRGEIEYVHTFQHALKVCGINLEIKI